MKDIVEILQKSKKIYKKFIEIKPAEIGIRNKIRLFVATDLNYNHTCIFVVSQKSRVLRKDVLKYETIRDKIEKFSDKSFKYKTLIINAPLCSHAESELREIGWKVVKNDTL